MIKTQINAWRLGEMARQLGVLVKKVGTPPV
jgi:hypothetical protein